MKNIFFVLMMLITGAVYAADVQLDDGPNGMVPVAGLVEDLKTSINKVTLLDAQMVDLTSTNETLLKEYKVLAENNKQVLAEFEQTKTNFVTNVINPYRKQKQAEMDGVAEQYNRNCAKERVGDLPRSQYDRCVAWQNSAATQIEAIKKEGEQHIKGLADKFDSTETKHTNDIINRQNVRINQINSMIKANFATWENVKASNVKLRKHIDVLEGMLRNKCTNAQPQTMKWCNSISWDGASKKLKPLPGG